MKDRFTALDVRVVVANIRENLLGMRVGNIYDINPRTYMFKLQETGQDKKLILIESGMRVHSTKYMRDIPKIPSIFTLKLRKHVRSKRLTDVRQLGIDRVIDFTFGTGEATYHIIVELHSKGNVILTDHKYSIITLLRTFKPANSDILIATNHLYPVQDGDFQELKHVTLDEVKDRFKDSPPSISLKQFLMKTFDFGTAFIHHCVVCAGYSPNLKLSKVELDFLDSIYEELMKAEAFTIAVNKKGNLPGWIVMRNSKEEAEEREKKHQESLETNPDAISPTPIFESFVPFLYKQHENQEIRSFETFDEAVDEYFSKIESQKMDVQKTAKASVVQGKLGKVKRDQTKRIEQLESKTEEYQRKALLIQDNIDDVEKAIMIIRSALSTSMDWSELGRIVKEEKKNGDRIAEIIYKLELEKNHISLLLSNIPYDSSEEELTGEPEVVDVDIELSAHANVKRYFDMKKSAKEKKLKTEAAVNQALKAAQKKAEREIKQVKVKTGIQKMRKQLWFEKFYWFISSDNYVVISGRDAQQNELIVKRYMQKGDLYVHADIHGASSCVIKNPSGQVVSPSTLEQAGQMAICRSAAWSAKVVTSAYWVYHHQVSKTAPSGEYLTTGSFMIRGKKNFLPPAQLVMGFGLLFRVDESCLSRHVGERGIGAAELAEKRQESDSIAAEQDADENSQFQKIGESLPSTKDDENTEEKEQAGDSTICGTEKEQPVDIESEGSEESEEEEEEDEEEEEEEKQVETSSGKKESFQPSHLGIPDKYRIDYDEEEEEEEEEDDGNGSKGSRKRISKRDRKLMKKGIDPSSVPPSAEVQKEQPKQTKKPAKQPQQELTRRQRRKMKKMKSKYADQDEEERALRMKILGSAGPNKGETEEETDDIDENETAEERPALTQEEAKKMEEKKRKMKEEREESLQALTAEAMGNLSLLDELTGKPLEDDVLLCAIPMCGPYAAVKDFKFKVKLVPGTAKTGRAVQTALNVFKQTNEITAQEKDLITSMNDAEAMLQMMGGVTISTPGLSNLSKNKKGGKGKKGGKKKRGKR